METPEAYQVAFENEFVRIVQVTLDARREPPKYTPAALPMVRVIIDSDDPRTAGEEARTIARRRPMTSVIRCARFASS